jgi:hypothetical protein
MARIFGPDQIPVLVKHVTLAIQAKPLPSFGKAHVLVVRALGRGAEAFATAFIMAINSLKRQGFLTHDSSPYPGDTISLTGKGTLAEKLHRAEGGGKESRFNQLYQQAFSEQEIEQEKKEEGGQQAEVAPPKRLQQKSKNRAGTSQPVSSVKKTEVQKDPYKKTRLKKASSGHIRKAPSARMSRVPVKKPPKGRV